MMKPPKNEKPDPTAVPIALRWQLNLLGYDDRAIARLKKGGELARPRRGAYVDEHRWAALDAVGKYVVRCRAAALQAKTEVVLSHLVAAAVLGAPLWGFDLAEADLTRLDGKAGRREAGVRQHCGTIVEGDVVEHAGMKVMSATRAALEVTTIGPTEAALVVVCDLLHRGLTTLEALQQRYASMESWPNTLATELVMRLARPELASVGEVRTWHLLYRHSIPVPELQHEIRDETGEVVARVDFAWPDLGVYLEFDGKVKYQKHLRPGESVTDAVLREKRREEEIYRLTGWRCIRISWADLENPDRTAAMIRRMLAPRAA